VYSSVTAQADELMMMARELPEYPPSVAPIRKCLDEVMLVLRCSEVLMRARETIIQTRGFRARLDSHTRAPAPSSSSSSSSSFQSSSTHANAPPDRHAAAVRALVAYVRSTPDILERACLWMPGLTTRQSEN